MEANYAGAVAKLREVLDKLDPADPILAAKEEVLGKYGPLFRPERVQKITAEEFVSFLQPENNRHWSGLQRQASAITADMEALRHGLALLVDESQPLAPRFTRALQSVRGLGPAIASAILLVAYPDRYGVWNRISESALKKLGIWPSVPRGATKGEIYQRINELLLRLHDDLGVDLWTLDLILWRVVSDQPSPAVTPDLARWFAEEMKKPDYVQRERHYKVAVHLIVRRLLSPASLEAPNFPGLLAKFFQGQLEPEELGLNADEAVEVRQKLTSSGLQLFEAIVSLAGGRWGVNQMTWIPRAVERGFGEELRAAFRTLVDDDLSLDDRVDAFREALEVVQARLRDAGGFEPHWRIVTPSHPFVGMILGAYDPHQYTFYHAGAFKQAF
ncbi:hypothetical protein H5T52_12350, partial [Candidatus Bipolaricaulota bacterium]|nr:hypothetical protein [Candidatus Bipolaricaulota bacterium]